MHKGLCSGSISFGIRIDDTPKYIRPTLLREGEGRRGGGGGLKLNDQRVSPSWPNSWSDLCHARVTSRISLLLLCAWPIREGACKATLYHHALFLSFRPISWCIPRPASLRLPSPLFSSPRFNIAIVDRSSLREARSSRSFDTSWVGKKVDRK